MQVGLERIRTCPSAAALDLARNADDKAMIEVGAAPRPGGRS